MRQNVSSSVLLRLIITVDGQELQRLPQRVQPCSSINRPPHACSAKAHRAHVWCVLGYEKEKRHVQVCRRPTSPSSLCCLAVVGTLSFALAMLLDHKMAGQVEVLYVPLRALSCRRYGRLCVQTHETRGSLRSHRQRHGDCGMVRIGTDGNVAAPEWVAFWCVSRGFSPE